MDFFEALDYSGEDVEKLWVGEALTEGLVQEGDRIPVSAIYTVPSGKGFRIDCELEVDGRKYRVLDFTWRKSKLGNVLASLLSNCHRAAGESLTLVAQSKQKNAVLSYERKPGYWVEVLDESDALTGVQWIPGDPPPEVSEVAKPPKSLRSSSGEK